MVYSIAIDGPAGAGKSTIAKNVAKKLNFIYVDTGAMYRAIAFYFLNNKINAEDSLKVEEACNNIKVSIEYIDGEQQVILNDENITNFIRTEEVGNMASTVAAKKEVRAKLLDLQRNLANKENVIMDGRDIGTFVLPNADVKIYLTASATERAKRRWKELKDKGIECNLDEIENDIIDRDNRDMNRDVAPLRQADDATLVDSSFMSIEEVVEKIIQIFRGKEKN